MKKIRHYFERNLINLAIITLIIGLLIIVVFSLIKPFNDFSFSPNPELFGLYGNFIGGLVGVMFSLVAVVFLYKTLITQQETLVLQNNLIQQQKRAFETEQFETTFFNLLKTQREITDQIKSYFVSLDSEFTPKTFPGNGREFFIYAKSELSKIWKNVENKTYLGYFDNDNVPYLKNEINQLYENDDTKYFDKDYLKSKEEHITDIERLKFANKFYKIKQDKWTHYQNESMPEKLKSIYAIFFQNYHYVIGHYYRHLYHIISYVDQFENISPMNEQVSKRYIDFIQAQMSSYELMLLYYNSMLFPKLQELLIRHNFLENLAIEDLIDESHHCINKINLKKRAELIGDNE